MTPVARKIYTKCRLFTKQNNTLRKSATKFKQRLKYARKFTKCAFWKQYSALSDTQKTFLNMQITNQNKKRKVHFSTFCTKIKLALKSICKDEHSRILKENLTDFTPASHLPPKAGRKVD